MPFACFGPAMLLQTERVCKSCQRRIELAVDVMALQQQIVRRQSAWMRKSAFSRRVLQKSRIGEPFQTKDSCTQKKQAREGMLDLHGGCEGVVEGVHAVGLVPPDEGVLRVQRVHEEVLHLVQPRRLAQGALLRERRLTQLGGWIRANSFSRIKASDVLALPPNLTHAQLRSRALAGGKRL